MITRFETDRRQLQQLFLDDHLQPEGFPAGRHRAHFAVLKQPSYLILRGKAGMMPQMLVNPTKLQSVSGWHHGQQICVFLGQYHPLSNELTGDMCGLRRLQARRRMRM